MSRRSDVAVRRVVPAPPAEACDVLHLDPVRVDRLRAALIGADLVESLAETFRALGDPTRVRILDALSHGELCVCDLAASVGMKESAASHALRLLRTHGVVKVRRDGRMAYYSLSDGHVRLMLDVALEHQRHEQV